MAAYVMSDFEVTDPAGMAAYQEVAVPILARYGARLLAVGPPTATLEGSWQPKGVAIIEFPSVEQLHQWYDAPEYQEPKGLRQRSGRFSLIVVDGLPAQVMA